MATKYEPSTSSIDHYAEHSWLCVTPGCPHRQPPKYASALDAWSAAHHHVRHTGHSVRVELVARTIATCTPADLEEAADSVR